MAGAGYKLFNTGDVLTAAQVNTYLQEQAVMRFASAAARTTALSGVVAEGMVSYLMDTNAVEVYDGSAWVGVATGDITGITTGATSGLTGGVTSGTADLKLNTTAKGGLLVGTGSGSVTELSVGTNNFILTADSSTASGLKWASGGSSALTLIKTQTIGSAVSSVTVTSAFSSTYDNYVILVYGGALSGSNNMNLQLGSTTTGYYQFAIYGGAGGSTVYGDNVNNGSSFAYPVSGSTVGIFGKIELFSPNLADETAIIAYSNRPNSGSFSWIQGTESSSTQHTAFTLTCSAGTATGGTIAVYGYQKS